MYLKDDSSISNINNRCAIAVSHVFFYIKLIYWLHSKGLTPLSTLYVSTYFLRSQWQSPFT